MVKVTLDPDGIVHPKSAKGKALNVVFRNVFGHLQIQWAKGEKFSGQIQIIIRPIRPGDYNPAGTAK